MSKVSKTSTSLRLVGWISEHKNQKHTQIPMAWCQLLSLGTQMYLLWRSNEKNALNSQEINFEMLDDNVINLKQLIFRTNYFCEDEWMYRNCITYFNTVAHDNLTIGRDGIRQQFICQRTARHYLKRVYSSSQLQQCITIQSGVKWLFIVMTRSQTFRR